MSSRSVFLTLQCNQQTTKQSKSMQFNSHKELFIPEKNELGFKPTTLLSGPSGQPLSYQGSSVDMG